MVKKDGEVLVEYDSTHTLVETHFKGLEIIREQLKKNLLDNKN